MFEPHGDSYIVFTKAGGARFSAEERDAYVAAHHKAKPGWKTFPIVMACLLGETLVAFVALNLAIRLWPAVRSSPDIMVAVVLTIFLTMPIVLMGSLTYPALSLIGRIRREAARRTQVALPREQQSLVQKVLIWVASLGVTGFIIAFALGLVTFTWPWILTTCGIVALVTVLAVYNARRNARPKPIEMNGQSPSDR